MGRKIPGRKHHGVRDPEKQRQERFKKIKDKINAPPVNPEDQQIPKSLQRLQELRDKTKNGHLRTIKKPEPKKPRFEQRKGESNSHFLYRINKVCEDVIKEAAFKDKYGVDVERNAAGEITSVKKRPKDPVELMVKQAKKEQKEKKLSKKKKKKKKEGVVDEPRLTKSQKRRVKLLAKKNKKNLLKDDDSQEVVVDQLRFGEQSADGPPTLTAPKKVKDKDSVSRPGTRNLLLKQLLSNQNAVVENPSAEIIDKTGKRKNLPTGLRRQLDLHREEIVRAYKELKSKRITSIR